MKRSTKDAITAGILFGIALDYFQRAVLACMSDDICHYDRVVFHNQNGDTRRYVAIDACPCMTEEEVADEKKED